MQLAKVDNQLIVIHVLKIISLTKIGINAFKIVLQEHLQIVKIAYVIVAILAVQLAMEELIRIVYLVIPVYIMQKDLNNAI